MQTYNPADVESFYNLTDEHFEGAYLANSERVDYFNALNKRKVKILKTKEYIRLLPFCMYYRKHSCLIQPFDQEILAFTSSGLIDLWAKKFRKSLQNKSDKNEPKPLSLKQIVGVIIMCSYLFAASLIIFILELLSTKFEAIKCVIDFLMFTRR